jgi:hypothetical protein
MTGGRERRSLWLTRIACSFVLALGGSAVSQARQLSARAPAVQVRVTTITAFAVPLAGQRVRVIDGVVSTIASSRFFVLSGSGLNAPFSGSRRVAVVLESGEATLSLGQRVVVTGIVRGSLAQQEEVGRPAIGSLTVEERDALKHRPLLIVSSAENLAQQ